MKKVYLLGVCFVLFVLVVAIAYAAIQPAPANTVRVYRDYQCTTGPQTTFQKGNYSNLTQYPQNDENAPYATIPGTNWNDQISCLTIGEGVSKVTIYQHANYKGKSKTLKKQSNNPLGAWSFAKDWWNDSISSIKIE
jgi:hypothetical protein